MSANFLISENPTSPIYEYSTLDISVQLFPLNIPHISNQSVAIQRIGHMFGNKAQHRAPIKIGHNDYISNEITMTKLEFLFSYSNPGINIS